MGKQVKQEETLGECLAVLEEHINALRRLHGRVARCIQTKEFTPEQLSKIRSAFESKNFAELSKLIAMNNNLSREGQTVKALRIEAALLGIKGYQSANKWTLIRLLEEYDAF